MASIFNDRFLSKQDAMRGGTSDIGIHFYPVFQIEGDYLMY